MAMVENKTIGRKVFNITDIVLMCLFSVIFIYPYLLVIGSSFTSETSLLVNGYQLIPNDFSAYAYEFIFSSKLPFLQAYWNTIWVTAVSVVLTTSVCFLYAYALQHPKLKGKKFFNLYLVVTLLFSGGLVPNYLIVTTFFKDSLWSIIIPGLIAAWYTFLIRNYMVTISRSLSEAAEMDGAGQFTILTRIYVPLSKPIIATICLFVAVSQWNSYTGPLLYLESENNYTLQLVVNKMSDLMANLSQNNTTGRIIPAESGQMAAVVVSTLPIICLYPFLQKYFITGITLGGVKE